MQLQCLCPSKGHLHMQRRAGRSGVRLCLGASLLGGGGLLSAPLRQLQASQWLRQVLHAPPVPALHSITRSDGARLDRRTSQQLSQGQARVLQR